ncbi:MAG: radical SAM/CxCxxxxC motif protein YfkAB [Bacillaceae bacterium]|nr:radical SAM/CxCxxxxC motif protein YfkAB [Bacillaceae bacterium]
MIFMKKKANNPDFDAWEAYIDVDRLGKMQLSSVEFTTTNLCNMRCEHCAVGYTLQTKDPHPLPIELLLQRLEEIPHLRTISITGGEPMLSLKSVNDYVLPLMKYAHERDVYTQINSNLTLDLDRYEKVVPYLDVLHISHNYGSIEDFTNIGFAMMNKKPTLQQQEAYYYRMIANAKALSKQGVLVSAETMLNKRTLPHLEEIHDQIVSMGCSRHEVHPMYPSDFASKLEVLEVNELREGIERLLAHRNQDVWMLFGTLPFYPCNTNHEDLNLLKRIYSEKNVTVRNDPDGRSRLNVNIFSGDIIITDFGDVPAFGNIRDTKLVDAYNSWNENNIAKSLACHCPAVKCLGPNLLVKETYYNNQNFLKQKANLTMV